MEQMTMRRSVIALFVLAACGGVEPLAPRKPINDPELLYMSLTLNHGAINMSTAAPYNAFQLIATPRNALGAPMSGLPAPTFRSSDTTRVQVSREGMLQARRLGTGIRIIAEILADGNVRHADTARVNVTTNPTPPVLTTFSITPPPDSAVWSMLPINSFLGHFLFLMEVGINFLPSLTLRALDANNAPIPGLAVEYESLNPAIVQFSNPITGLLRDPFGPGKVGIVVRTVAYGIPRADTAVFTVTYPAVHGVIDNLSNVGTPPNVGTGLGPRFGEAPIAWIPSSITIRPNGFVFWTNRSKEPMNVTFDDPTNVAEITALCASFGGAMCGAGNIPAFADPEGTIVTAMRGRQFPVPGVYRYRNSLTGGRGEVIVTDGAAP